MLTDEIWKPIEGYEGYFSVSSLGNVRSETRTVPHKRHGSVMFKGKPITPTTVTTGKSSHCLVTLTKNGAGKSHYVHRLVAAAFVPIPDGQDVVTHLDGDGTNNSASNLAWVSASESTLQAYRSGKARGNVGEKNPSAKLTEEDVRQIRRLLGEGCHTQRRIAEMYGVVPMVITDIKMGRTWTDVQ